MILGNVAALSEPATTGIVPRQRVVPRLPDHCRENSPASRDEGLLVLLQAGQHGEISLIQYRVGNLVLRLQAWSAFPFTIQKNTVFCPCSISCSVPRPIFALFLCERWHSQIVRMERANHSLCGVIVRTRMSRPMQTRTFSLSKPGRGGTLSPFRSGRFGFCYVPGLRLMAA
jgi:hypothetical protein